MFAAHILCNISCQENYYAIQVIKECSYQGPKNRLGQHATICLGFNSDKTQVLMCGGRLPTKPDSSELLPDAWMFDLNSEKWKEVRVASYIYIIVKIPC